MLQLYLQHDFYNVIFTIKHKSHIASESGPTPPVKNSEYTPNQRNIRTNNFLQ